ncbi:MAG: PSD1 and planctomycete cytochrome C domain-containing protein [Phycisphaerales bacterium JB063]
MTDCVTRKPRRPSIGLAVRNGLLLAALAVGAGVLRAAMQSSENEAGVPGRVAEVQRVSEQQHAGPLSFQRDVRPILSDKCFACHGPDPGTRGADLRLDVTGDGEGYVGAYAVIEPGDVSLSVLVERIDHPRAHSVMPPPESGLELTDQEKASLRRWIEEGAVYEAHWAYLPPERAVPPAVGDAGWLRNDIDAFVLARLEREGLAPSREADPATLIRRLTFDLTGLPPTVEEVDRFIHDDAPDAYERAVDRLLASPHFGERLALPWLDAARYADTNGFSIDDHRDMWLWREWVIDALNRNMPYDQFMTQQLAGDLLPDATSQQQLATGFLRNSMNTHEGGTIPEEYRVIYIADKIDTVSSVFLGLTMRCAQCHDHKYDPLSQREYFQFYAFFNTAHEPGNGAVNGNTAPVIRTDGPLTDAATYRRDLERRIATLERYKLHPPELVEARAQWEAEVIATAKGDLAEALNLPATQRTEAQWQAINAEFAKTTELWGQHQSTIHRELAVLAGDLEAGQASAMVMREEGPRQTYVLTRGAYDQPDHDQPVSAGVPAVLPTMHAEGTPPRLALAHWLAQPDHPLTARVAVNRYWQMLFGRGIVSTPNDFGSQGAYPSHPDLLDWLAVEYIDSGWDTKHLLKLMVMSATYRQSSFASPALLERDPNNELLARASRFRLPAEFIRDAALAAAGRLDLRVGGPSVYPQQPHGLWREVSHFGYPDAFTAQAFYPSDDAGQHRRSMYTFWKRTNPPPSLSAFDAPTREVCTIQRSRTNTPLQALVLLNDPEYVKAARALAGLAIQHTDDPDARIRFMFRRVTARLPEAQELALLRRLHAQAVERFTQQPDDARAMTPGLVSAEQTPDRAAWAVVASTILNLDQAITRE